MQPLYLDHFGLREAPFSIAPDPAYLYLGAGHREALAHLAYGVLSDNGFVMLSGDVGTGKTTLCRALLRQLPEHCEAALIFNPPDDARLLLENVCREFRILVPAANRSLGACIARLNDYLLETHARGRMAVLIIDEAQGLSPAVLEQVRLLTNLETEARKLLHIVLLGQPQLREMLAQPAMAQLNQRIVARYHLGPLNAAQTRAYVEHRLACAGAPEALFTPWALRRLHRASGGIPRLINVLADRALLGAYARGRHKVDAPTLGRAAREALGTFAPQRAPSHRALMWGEGAALAALLALPIVPPAGSGMLAALPATPVPDPAVVVVPPANRAPPATATAGPAETNEAVPPEASAATAFAALFAAWGIHPGPIQDPEAACARARADGLGCVHGSAGLESLLRQGRPAVLELGQGAHTEYATLLGVSGERARVLRAGSVGELDLARLVGEWSGRYTLFWLPALEADRVLRPGASGPAVEGLARVLTRLDGQPAAEPSGRFDDRLGARLAAFQSAQGLRADGIAGPRTLERLDAVARARAPRLEAAVAEGGVPGAEARP